MDTPLGTRELLGNFKAASQGHTGIEEERRNLELAPTSDTPLGSGGNNPGIPS